MRNAIGWSAYSPIGYILAASKPAAPPAPTYVSSTSTTVTMSLQTSLDDGGSPITGYALYRDDGDDFTSSYTIMAYTSGTTYTTVAADAITSKAVYRFVYVAINAVDSSDYSPPLIAGVGAKVPAPSTPTVTYALSN